MKEQKAQGLKNKLLKQIQNGTYPPGSALPSERKLADTEKIARMTVRHAINDLVNQGVLYRHQGRGTFVSANKYTQNNLMSFSRAIKNKGKIPGTYVLTFKLIERGSYPKVDDVLNCPKYFISRRLRVADETPVALETVFIPFENCPNLKKNLLEGSLHRLLKEKYDLEAKTCELTVSAAFASDGDAADLKLSKNTPVLHITSKYFSPSGQIAYYEKAVYRGDMYEYVIHTVKGASTIE